MRRVTGSSTVFLIVVVIHTVELIVIGESVVNMVEVKGSHTVVVTVRILNTGNNDVAVAVIV